MRIIMLRACIGVYCSGRVFGCSINGVKSECVTCDKSRGGQCHIRATVGNFTHSLCSKCLKVALKHNNTSL